MTGPECLSEAIKAESFPSDFKEPRKVVNYEPNMDPTSWLSSYEMAMSICNATRNLCAKFMYLMMDGAAKVWMRNLPPRSISSWEQLKVAFVQNFQGTCKKLSTIEDLERCVQKKGESARHWMKRVSEIIKSSQGLPPISVLMAMERNCTFNPVAWKLGRMKDSMNQGIHLSIGEIMTEANKHASTDKTKDPEEAGKGQGGSGPSQNQNHGQNHDGTKRP